MPKQINTPTPGQALVRAFALKGRFQPVLDETIVPVVVVETATPEVRKLSAWGVSAAAPGVGQQNIAYLENPTNSGHTVVLTSIWALSSLADDVFQIRPYLVPINAAGIGIWRDTRLDGLPNARHWISDSATIVLGFPQYPMTGIPQPVEWILKPGTYITMVQQGANETLQVMWEWYEIALTGGSGF